MVTLTLTVPPFSSPSMHCFSQSPLPSSPFHCFFQSPVPSSHHLHRVQRACGYLHGVNCAIQVNTDIRHLLFGSKTQKLPCTKNVLTCLQSSSTIAAWHTIKRRKGKGKREKLKMRLHHQSRCETPQPTYPSLMTFSSWPRKQTSISGPLKLGSFTHFSCPSGR